MRNKLFSLGVKMLLVNLVAPLMLVGGFFLIDDYKKVIIDSEFKHLELNADLIAISFVDYKHIIDDVSRIAPLRVQIFSGRGALLADSRNEAGSSQENIVQLQHLISTLTEGQVVRTLNLAEHILDVIVPVYSPREEIIGAIRLYTSSHALEQSIADVTSGLIIMSGVALLITVLLSWFFAKNIVSPLNALAQVAQQIEERVSIVEIPDYGTRRDEIGQLAGALSTMMSAIAKKLAAFESFASDVSHEIKNPLTSILSAIETVQKISDNEKKERLLRIIFDDVGRLDRLITDISSLSKVSAQVSEEMLQRVEVVPLLELLIQVYQYNENGQTVVLQYDPSLRGAAVMASETRLSQVFHNLISNAISFSEEGAEIFIRIAEEGGSLTVAVIDSGKGFPEGKEEKIFERFYCGREPEQCHKHSGLGLALSKTIVESFNGTITASHNKPQGAIFTVRLPLAK